MDPTIAKLRGYGHHNNPMIRAAFVHLTEDDWNAMTPEDELGMLLVRSFQMSMAAEHESNCWKHHKQAAQYDGLIGKATEDTLRAERCGCEDYLALETLEATGRGSWPSGCHPDYPNNHVTYVYFDMRGASSQVKSWWAEVWGMVQEAYREIGLLILETDDSSKANHVLSFESLGGSTIGLAIVGTGQRCNTQIWLKIDKNYLPSAVRVAQVVAHEFAHNMGVGHIAGDPIQNSSVVNQDWNGSFKGTALGNVLSQMFGGEPVPRIGGPQPPDEPQPPTGGGKIALRGKIRIQNYGKEPIVIQPGAEYPESFIIIPE